MIFLHRHAELVSASIPETSERMETWTLKQVQGDGFGFAVEAQKLLGISLEGSVG
ncbi:MAG: hypothetical protein ACJ8EG_09185 [Sphingomicrobium sp.]